MTSINNDIAKKWVEAYLKTEGLGIPQRHFEHLVQTGSQVVLKHLTNLPAGSFVTAVVENNLMETVKNADSINKQYLDFYCRLVFNLPKNLFEK